jgi:xylan 1,4-beta-xylosidase
MSLFNASSKALKDVHPSLRVGGPATMQLLNVAGVFLSRPVSFLLSVSHSVSVSVADFIAAANERQIDFDFVSTHMYPTDPQCTRASSKHGAPPAWRPDCFTNHVKNASKIARAAGKPFYMTEYNVGCCPDTQSDDAGAAAFVFQEIAELDGHADILSWWTFTDVFGVYSRSLSLSSPLFLTRWVSLSQRRVGCQRPSSPISLA